MKRYTKNSKIKKILLKTETIYAEIIKEPNKSLDKDTKIRALEDIRSLIKEAWGEYTDENIEKGVFGAYFLCILRNPKNELVGIVPIKKYIIDGREIFSFSLSAISHNYRNQGLLKKSSVLLVKKLFLENLLAGKLRIEFVFITPNIRTLGTMSRVASFMYPNPYKIDPKTHKIAEADEVTWRTVKKFLELAGEKYRVLEKKGCIMEGFYDDKPHLVYKEKITHPDKELEDFGKYYVYNKKGRDVVARAILDPRGLFRS